MLHKYFPKYLAAFINRVVVVDVRLEPAQVAVIRFGVTDDHSRVIGVPTAINDTHLQTFIREQLVEVASEKLSWVPWPRSDNANGEVATQKEDSGLKLSRVIDKFVRVKVESVLAHDNIAPEGAVSSDASAAEAACILSSSGRYDEHLVKDILHAHNSSACQRSHESSRSRAKGRLRATGRSRASRRPSRRSRDPSEKLRKSAAKACTLFLGLGGAPFLPRGPQFDLKVITLEVDLPGFSAFLATRAQQHAGVLRYNPKKKAPVRCLAGEDIRGRDSSVLAHCQGKAQEPSTAWLQLEQ